MGLDWRIIVALLTRFLAKEKTIAILGVLFCVLRKAGEPIPGSGQFYAPTKDQ